MNPAERAAREALGFVARDGWFRPLVRLDSSPHVPERAKGRGMTGATTSGFRNVTVVDFFGLVPRPRLIDVREPEEFGGELGHIASAELVPLATLREAAASWSRTEPLVVACRSGKRSVTAALSLVELGFSDIRNLEGGMLAHRGAGLPVERG